MRKRPPPAKATPEGLELTLAYVDGEELAILSFPVKAPPCFAGLTEAERHVAESLVAGLSNAHIAAARGTSVRTVTKQVASVFRKLGVGSRRQLVARACGR